ncbi:hypothetical protein AB3S75_031580 [Citrus x aurantiifolia]
MTTTTELEELQKQHEEKALKTLSTHLIGNLANATGTTTTTELEALQKQHEEKVLKIKELKKQIESTKVSLEEEEKKNAKESGFSIACVRHTIS